MPTLQTIPLCLIECLAIARAPTGAEVEHMAQRIWADFTGDTGGRRWREMEWQSPEKRRFFQMAWAALAGSGGNFGADSPHFTDAHMAALQG